MSEKHDQLFHQHRRETFDRVIALIEERIRAATPALLQRFDEMSMDVLRRSAEKESWSLFLHGILHLKNGAPDHQPGSMTEALSRMSLRSSSFAATLGVKPPQFERMYFSIDYTNGYEAALFFCQRALKAAQVDLPKSRQIIHHKIMTEKPAGVFGDGADKHDVDLLKKQMALSFNVLAETYGAACGDFMDALSGLTPPVSPQTTEQGKNFPPP